VIPKRVGMAIPKRRRMYPSTRLSYSACEMEALQETGPGQEE